MRLIGIVKKNAIMMIDFALDAERDARASAARRDLRGVPAAVPPDHDDDDGRALGALPLAIGSGNGAELRRPLGISIVGGLICQPAADAVHHAGRLPLPRSRHGMWTAAFAWRAGARACDRHAEHAGAPMAPRMDAQSGRHDHDTHGSGSAAVRASRSALLFLRLRRRSRLLREARGRDAGRVQGSIGRLEGGDARTTTFPNGKWWRGLQRSRARTTSRQQVERLPTRTSARGGGAVSRRRSALSCARRAPDLFPAVGRRRVGALGSSRSAGDGRRCGREPTTSAVDRRVMGDRPVGPRAARWSRRATASAEASAADLESGAAVACRRELAIDYFALRVAGRAAARCFDGLARGRTRQSLQADDATATTAGVAARVGRRARRGAAEERRRRRRSTIKRRRAPASSTPSPC